MPSFLKVGLALWFLVFLGVAILLIAPSSDQTFERPYLLPWVAALGIVTITPAAYLLAKDRFDPFHPLIFPVWTYFFPGFVIGGLILASGYSQAHYIAYIRDETTDLPLTFLYLIIGFAALALGFSFRGSRAVGEFVTSRLIPNWELSDSEAKIGGIVLLAVGLLTMSMAFLLGIFGFQQADEISSYGGLVAMSTVFWYQATLILSLYIFRHGARGFGTYAVFGVILASATANALLAGTRSGPLHFLLPILAAFLYSRRKIVFKHFAGFGLVLAVMLIAGMIYGTTFRNIRETPQMVSFDEYAATVPRTFERILEQDPTKVFADGFAALATRVELVSSLAVVVSNYEVLAPYEEELGISNNIMVDTFTFFIPRVIWSEKPISIEPAKYAELYFNYSENSFSMTPIGDLIRNFGPVGIPIGMFLLGGFLRVIHISLLGKQQFSYWRIPLYFLLITAVSYDATFGGIVPTLFKTAVVASIGLGIVWLVTVRINRRRFGS